jgi:hypothetical protein
MADLNVERPNPNIPMNAPMDPGNGPMAPMNAPMDPGNGPMNAPMDPMNAPMDPMNAPMDPGNTPVDPMNAPMDPMNVPMDPMNAPMDPMNAPMDPMNAPVDPMNAPMDPGNDPMNPMNAPMDPGNDLSSAHISTTSGNLNKTNDPKFKEKTETFENLIMDLHERYMNLPEKIGKYAHDKLLVNAERILTDYSNYITPNVEYMVENMKKKLEILNPSGGIGQKGEKVVNKLKSYLKNFVGQSINFSQFNGNTKDLNEQFNIVLSKLIENLKNGTKDEITTLVQLLNKLIKEMMKKHSVGKDLKPEDLLDRIKSLAMRPIQLIRGNKDEQDSVKTNVVIGEGKNEGQNNVTFKSKSTGYNVGLDARLKNAIEDNKRDTEKDKKIKELTDRLQEALKDDKQNKVIGKLTKQVEDAKKQRTKTDAEKQHLLKTYKEDNFKHLKERIDLLIGILKEKIANYDKRENKSEVIEIVKYIYNELIDRIDTNLYSPKFDEEKRKYLKEKKEEAKKIFDDFLNNILKQAQEEQEIGGTPHDCDEKGWKKWFNETFEILTKLKEENETLFNNLYEKVLNKIKTDKAEFEKLQETDSKRAGKQEMVEEAIKKLNELKSGTSTNTLTNICKTALYGRESPNEEVQQACDIKNYSNNHSESIRYIKANKKIEDTAFVEKVATETMKVINENRRNKDNFTTVLGPVEDILGFLIKYVSGEEKDNAFKKVIVLSVKDATWTTDFNYDFINCSINTGKNDDNNFNELNSELPIVLLNVGDKSILEGHYPTEILTKLPRVTQCEIEWVREKIQDTSYKWEIKKIKVDNKLVWIHILKLNPIETTPKTVGTYSLIEKCYSYHDVYCLLNLSKKNAK